MNLVELLNRTEFYEIGQRDDAIGRHFRKLSEVLFEVDPMRLRGFGVPRNEYEPEAAFALAKLSGFKKTFAAGEVCAHLADCSVLTMDTRELATCCNESLREMLEMDNFVSVTDADLWDMDSC
jgi:hypothetical protein